MKARTNWRRGEWMPRNRRLALWEKIAQSQHFPPKSGGFCFTNFAVLPQEWPPSFPPNTATLPPSPCLYQHRCSHAQEPRVSPQQLSWKQMGTGGKEKEKKMNEEMPQRFRKSDAMTNVFKMPQGSCVRRRSMRLMVRLDETLEDLWPNTTFL